MIISLRLIARNVFTVSIFCHLNPQNCYLNIFIAYLFPHSCNSVDSIRNSFIHKLVAWFA